MAQESSFDSERRSAERFPVSLSVETDRGPGTTRDVSVSGLYLVTAARLAVGDHLGLTIAVPDPDQPQSPVPLHLVLQGRVVRVEEASGVVGVGIALDEVSRYMARAS